MTDGMENTISVIYKCFLGNTDIHVMITTYLHGSVGRWNKRNLLVQGKHLPGYVVLWSNFPHD